MDASAINDLLSARVVELASRKRARNRAEHEERIAADRPALARALGLDPLPPRTDLKARVTGAYQRSGVRLEKIAFESQPGVTVTGHLYLPGGPGPFPAVLAPHGHWTYKKSEPIHQAQGIGLALQGIACLILDSPGFSWDDHEHNERRHMGPHDDPLLVMGLSQQGVYVWDVIRGLDYLETRADIDAKRIGVCGSSGGGTTSMFAFALDERIRAAAPVCSISSLEDQPHLGCLCNHVPVLALGDRADLLALRAGSPVLIVGAAEDDEFPPQGALRAIDKLKAVWKLFGAEDRVRLEIVDEPHDFSRRMREFCLAFFAEHLQGERPRIHLAEKLPLTDSTHNPAVGYTEPPDHPEFAVLAPEERGGETLRALSRRALEHPYPAPYDVLSRLVPWGRHGRIPGVRPAASLTLRDGVGEDAEGLLYLPFEAIDQRSLIHLGLGIPELFAQLIHQLYPGGPEGWETLGTGGPLLTSVIASMKTLINRPDEVPTLATVVAEGPVSSLTARFLKLYRPELAVQVSHPLASWLQVYDTEIRALSQPGARYLAFPG